MDDSLFNVNTDPEFSDKMEDPYVINSSKPIYLEFNEDLDMNTITDGIKVFNIKSDFKEYEVEVKITTKDNSSNILQINGKDNRQFSEGELYKLYIDKNVRSISGAALNEDFISYFAVNYSFNLDSSGITALNNERNMIICISDLHLGANDAYAELTENREHLINFLKHIKNSPNVKELVIVGDLIDEWFIPMNLNTFNGKTQAEFVKSVASNNKSVFEAFNTIIQEGNVKVTYVPGNHDILINTDDIESILPGISQARDVKGLGAYVPEDFPELVIEHGHRYNFYCAPDYSNRSITNTDSILPPGYFFTRMATSSVLEGRPKIDMSIPVVNKNELGNDQYLYFLYYSVWKTLISDFPVQEGLDAKVINTGIDGFNDFYSLKDVLPYQDSETGYIDTNLYHSIIESWEDRQDENLVQMKIATDEAILKGTLASHLDDQSNVQFFNNQDSDKKIVVFGHSHEARLITSIKNKNVKNVYANSGTWIDKCQHPTMTFVTITPSKTGNPSPTYVGLYQYVSEGEIKELNSQAMINL